MKFYGILATGRRGSMVEKNYVNYAKELSSAKYLLDSISIKKLASLCKTPSGVVSEVSHSDRVRVFEITEDDKTLLLIISIEELETID